MKADNRIVPPALAGFEAINRSWEPTLGLPCARILPGDYYVTPHDEALSTVLGSCISACVRVPRLFVGGMNHFMLPEVKDATATAGSEARYGTYAMECLINELLKRGADRSELEAKIVGGGRMYESKADIGRGNIDFVFEFLSIEGIKVVGKDIGGHQPRRVQYFPRTGRLRVKKLPNVRMESVEASERKHLAEISKKPSGGDIELF